MIRSIWTTIAAAGICFSLLGCLSRLVTFRVKSSELPHYAAIRCEDAEFDGTMLMIPYDKNPSQDGDSFFVFAFDNPVVRGNVIRLKGRKYFPENPPPVPDVLQIKLATPLHSMYSVVYVDPFGKTTHVGDVCIP